MSKAEKKELVQTAASAGEQFIKKHYNAEFILKDYEIIDPSVQSTVYLYGYVKGHEKDEITVVYSYHTHEVRTVIGPDWFIDSRKP
ncbi:hypothetical protein ACM1RC_26280 [Paenibacillus azoreducens]|uniref:hypothetical protein n=1 Tax=Paenibacillus azoreducens TaxID=116718 RepID=UPI0039F4CB71